MSASGRGVTPLKPTLVWPFDSDDDTQAPRGHGGVTGSNFFSRNSSEFGKYATNECFEQIVFFISGSKRPPPSHHPRITSDSHVSSGLKMTCFRRRIFGDGL